MRDHNAPGRRLLSLLLSLLLTVGLVPLSDSAAAVDDIPAQSAAQLRSDSEEEPADWTAECEVENTDDEEDPDYVVWASVPGDAFSEEVELFAERVEWEDLDEVYRALLTDCGFPEEGFDADGTALLDIGFKNEDDEKVDPAKPVTVALTAVATDENAAVDVFRIADVPEEEIDEDVPEEERVLAVLEIVASTDEEKLRDEDEEENGKQERKREKNDQEGEDEELEFGRVFLEDGDATALFEEQQFTLYLISITEPVTEPEEQEGQEEPGQREDQEQSGQDREREETPAPAAAERTVTFYGGGGTLEDGGTSYTQTAPADEDTVLETARFARPGYVFAGWSASVMLPSPDYEDGAVLPAGGSDVALYAVWSEEEPEPESTQAPEAGPVSEPDVELAIRPELELAEEPAPEQTDSAPQSDGYLMRADVLAADAPISSGSAPVTLASGVYYLSADITVTSVGLHDAFINLEDNADVTLYLNGHTLNMNGQGRAIYVAPGTKLTLADQYGTGGGTGGRIINGIARNIGGGAVYVATDGAFTMSGGTLSGNTTSDDGGAVMINGGAFTLNGGTISGNSADEGGGGVILSGGTFTMSGGAIKSNNAPSGGGVYLFDGEFSMTAGTIADNIGMAGGGGVYVYGGTFNVSGGTIGGTGEGTANTAPDGGGVYLYSGTLNVSGGAVSGNTARFAGGGVYLNYGDFTMTDGSISGNTAEEGSGGGVYASGGTFAMSGGSIRSNTAASGGGGVYANSEFRLSGNPEITGNTAGGAADNVYLPGDGVITVSGALTNTETKIGVTMEKPGVFTSGYSMNNGSTDPWERFAPDGAAFGIRWSDDNKEAKLGNGLLKVSGGGRLYTDGNPAELTAGVYYLTANVTAASVDSTTSALLRLASGAEVTLYLDGYQMSANSKGRVIYIPSGARLNLLDEYKESKRTGGRLTGGAGVSYGGGVYTAGTFNMSAGTISGNRANTDGGGVYVYGASGVLNMSGGEVSGNRAAYGGGLYGHNGGKITVSGGKISGNTGTSGAGGVLVWQNASFTLSGGEISGNTAQARGGGGVEVFETSSFTMSGGTISANSATGSGGGVRTLGTFTLTGGAIQNNTATVSGGGIYADGTQNLQGALTISGNKVGSAASNIYLTSGKKLTVTGQLTNPDRIGVTMAEAGVFTDGYSARNSADPWTLFAPDGAAFGIRWSDDNKEAKLGGGLLKVGGNGQLITDGKPVTLSGGTYYLTANVTAGSVGGNSAFLNLASGAGVTVYLNGYTLDLNFKGRAFYIDSGMTLTLADSIPASDYAGPRGSASTLTRGSVSDFDNAGAAVYVDGGTFTFSGGTITNCTANSFNVGGTPDSPGGAVYMGGGTFTMSGGTISGCNAGNGGGVYVNGGAFTMSGGTISGCSAAYGGGAYIRGGTFTMSGGTISGCKASSEGSYPGAASYGCGGGVYVGGGSLTMSGSSAISGNSTEEEGGGVYVYSGTFAMSGGTVQLNKVSGNGGGVSIDGGTFRLSGGTVQKNTAGGTGGGVYFGDGTFELSGGPRIAANVIGGTISGGNLSGGTANNVYLPSGKKITITGALSNSSAISVRMASPGIFTTDYTNKGNTARPSARFSSEDTGYEVALSNTGEAMLLQRGLIRANGYGGEFVTAGSPATLTEGTYYLTADVTASGAGSNGAFLDIAAGKTVTLILNGYKLDAAGKGRVIWAGSGATLKLYDSEPAGANLSLTYRSPALSYTYVSNARTGGNASISGGQVTGGSAGAGGGGGIYVVNGTLNMYGGVVCGNSAGSGGGVYVGGPLNMSGGTVCGNSADTGGGVYVTGGTLALSGSGRIGGNTAQTSGGGAYIDSGALTIAGSVVVCGNRAVGEHGGGVYFAGTTCGITGGTIQYNTAGQTGGGVYIGGGSLTMSGGTVSGNAAASGGGVYVSASGGAFELTGGTIGSNAASGNGGGIYVPSGHTLTVKGGTISGNTAANGGGVWSAGAFTMTNNGSASGTISGNSATGDGGGVYMTGAFTMSAGTIGGSAASDGNTATGDGGGVYVTGSGGSVTVSGGTIQYNKVTGSAGGGGIRAISGGSITISGDTTGDTTRTRIVNNSSKGWGGGVAITSDGSLTISGGAISNNSCDTSGGGLNIGSGFSGTATITGGTFSGNTAGTNGGGIARDAADGTVSISGVTLNNNTATGNGGGVYAVGAVTIGASSAISGNTAVSGGGVYAGAAISLTDVTLRTNRATTGAGGGIYAGGALTISGGTIELNAAGGNGGGVYANAELTMNGGTVQKNTAGSGRLGGGVYPGAAFSVSGAAAVTGNVVGGTISGGALSGGTTHNVYLPTDKTITVTGALTNTTAKIGVTMQTPGVFTSGYSDNNSATGPWLRFSSDNTNYGIELVVGEACLRRGLIKDDGQFITAGSPATLAAGTYYMTADVTREVDTVPYSGSSFITVANNAAVKLYLDGYTLDAGSRDRVLSVGTGATLELYDTYKSSGRTGGTVRGGSSTQGGGVYVAGTFTLQGGTIRNNTTTEGTGENGGGGVYVAGSGTFNMRGGSIRNNTSAYDGGGVKVYTGGKFNMSAGTITENSGTAGAGVDVWGTLALTGGTVSSNTAGGNGGGIRLYSNATVNMSGNANVTGNTAASGGGVYINGGTFTLSGGTIQLNTASGNGGGVCAASGGTFVLRAGTIRNNTAGAGSSGGGVYAGGSFRLSGGPTVTGNVAGGTVSGGALSGGTANQVYLASGRVITVDGTLSVTTKLSILMQAPGVFTGGYTTSGNTAAPSTYFVSGDTKYSVGKSAGGEAILIRNGLLREDGGGGEFITDGDPVTLTSGTYYLTADVTWNGAGSSGEFLNIAEGAAVSCN